MNVDPLAQMVKQLQPAVEHSKRILGAGRWRIRRSVAGQPFYCVVLEGGCRLALDGHAPIALTAGDFVLVPAASGFAMSSLVPPSRSEDVVPITLGRGLFRIGADKGPIDLCILAGHCSFSSPDAALLVSLLPQFVHVRGEPRLATLVKLVSDESSEQRPAREVVLAHLLQVVLIEALRSTSRTGASRGLMRGLADVRLAAAIRAMHEAPARAWTIAELAKRAALSRSSFFERFSRAVGVAPMEYLLSWRMALAKDMLRRNQQTVAEIADRVGYSSASTFSVAFTRQVGQPPSHYARDQARQLPH